MNELYQIRFAGEVFESVGAIHELPLQNGDFTGRRRSARGGFYSHRDSRSQYKRNRRIKVTPLIDPDRMEFEAAIYSLFADRQPDNLLLFYFSGHGVSDRDRNLYFTVPQTQMDERRRINPVTAVSAYFLQQQLTNSLSEREVVILDCCYSGAIAKGLTAKNGGKIDIQQELSEKGRAILTSSSALQSSF